MRIKGWPLGSHDEAQLVAVGSPDAQGRGQQWRTQAYFLSGGGESFDLRLPWGLLPKLRPSTVFLDGYFSGHSLGMEEVVIDIRSPPRFASWSEATSDEPGWFRIDALQDEQCLIFEVEGGTVVVPCIQVLRVFHAQTRLISHAVMRPGTMSEIATGDLRDHDAHLHIGSLVPSGVVTKAFARYLARLVFEPEWLDSFSDVFHRRFAWGEQSAVDKRARIPLQCIPPKASYMRWTARGQRLSNGTFFVADILSTFSSAEVPYRTLTIFHNKKGPPPKFSGSALGVDTADKERGGKEKRAKKEDPRDMSRPLLVRQRAIDHGVSHPARMFDVYPTHRPGGSKEGGRGKGGRTPLPSERTANVDDERKSGGQPSAEFQTVPGRDTLPLHFFIFTTAFRKVIERRSGWDARFSVEALSDYVPDSQPSDRLVLFVRIKTPQTLGYLIELEPLEGRTSYTLTVLRRSAPLKATIGEIGARLPKWLTNGGRSHVAALLKADEDYSVQLSTHRNLGESSWVERILEKIDPPSGRPSWTRGVAG